MFQTSATSQLVRSTTLLMPVRSLMALCLTFASQTREVSFIVQKSRRFHTFVANRVAIIQEVDSQWRRVDSSQNPADDASRGLSAEALLNNSRWLRGPDFLWRPESSWPIAPSPVLEVSPADPEVKSTAEVYSQPTEIRMEPVSKIFERFSSRYALKKFLCVDPSLS